MSCIRPHSAYPRIAVLALVPRPLFPVDLPVAAASESPDHAFQILQLGQGVGRVHIADSCRSSAKPFKRRGPPRRPGSQLCLLYTLHTDIDTLGYTFEHTIQHRPSSILPTRPPAVRISGELPSPGTCNNHYPSIFALVASAQCSAPSLDLCLPLYTASILHLHSCHNTGNALRLSPSSHGCVDFNLLTLCLVLFNRDFPTLAFHKYSPRGLAKLNGRSIPASRTPGQRSLCTSSVSFGAPITLGLLLSQSSVCSEYREFGSE